MMDNNKPLVSIITVVFNGEKYLKQTINSVLSQTYSNVEYIIVDGGSTDGTLNIIKEYESSITCLISEPDNGLYDAMNKGILLAKGELIGMINSDDWYEDSAVETVVETYLSNKVKNIFHADMYLVNECGAKEIRKFNPSTIKFIYYGMTYSHPTFFVTPRLYSRFQYNTKLKTISDYQFALEVFLDDPSTYIYINKPIANYRFGGLSDNIRTPKLLLDGFTARKNAGMNFFQNTISIVVRAVIFYLYKLKKKN